MEWYDVGRPGLQRPQRLARVGSAAGDARRPSWSSAGTHPPTSTAASEAATLHNDAGADNEEEGTVVWLCDGPRGSWSERWADLVHYDA